LEIEHDIRDCERRKDFGASFVALARSVYLTNDRGSEIKRAINAAGIGIDRGKVLPGILSGACNRTESRTGSQIRNDRSRQRAPFHRPPDSNPVVARSCGPAF
jgi:hypothetical protein